MKEIYLEVNDDFVTTQQKIKEAGGGDITLVVPQGSILSTPVNLRLLLRSAKSLNVTLTLRSESPNIQRIIDSISHAFSQSREEGDISPSGSFVIGRDIAAESPLPEPVPLSSPKKMVFSHWLKVLEKLGRQTASLFHSGNLITLLVFLIGFLVVGLILFILFSRTQKASIKLVVKPEGLIKSFEVSASPLAETVDAANKRIPAKVYEYTEVGSEATKATGTDIVGDKAKGTVTIYNKTDEGVELPKGTKLTLVRTEGEDLRYYLDSAVRIEKREATTTESQPGEFTVKYTSGRVEVGVTAESIGDTFNVGSGERFSVAESPIASYVGESQGAIKGGSKREAVVVLQADYDRVLGSLTERLTSGLKQRIPKELPEGVVVEPDAVEISVLSKSFDQPLGSVADEVTLNLTLSGKAYAYNREDLDNLLKESLVGFVPERFTLEVNNRQVTVEGVSIKQGELWFLAKVQGNAVPKLDLDKIKRDVAGKRVEIVQSYLGSMDSLQSYSLEIFPRLPNSLQVLPKDVSRINIEVSHEAGK